MSRILREFLFGDADIREYATITIDKEINEKVFLQIDETRLDISESQWLLCLNPIVFGIWINPEQSVIHAGPNQTYKMYFTDSSANGDSHQIKEPLAEVTLEYMDLLDEKDGSLLLLKLKKSSIYHINAIKTQLLFYKYYKKPRFSFANLKALVAAYSYPRRVRLVSFKEDEYYNIFPMDLLGDISQSNKYVFGLRHTNTALSKIITTKKIVVAEIPFNHKETIYQLGSHHSAGPPPVGLLPFKVFPTEKLGFYLPEWADSYKEIRIDKTINLGSHMLLFGEVINKCVVKKSSGHLYHIHYLLYLHQKRKQRAPILV
ncbi:hypothetical protein [Pedobacter sp. L105]|uniref:hypothetical protein n=1 Tax=Pedobacter sp. L105 TaxID=1641871 RepID=UPI00131BEF5E|nr:hypothetical protein [Pedobacter sp. L105]